MLPKSLREGGACVYATSVGRGSPGAHGLQNIRPKTTEPGLESCVLVLESYLLVEHAQLHTDSAYYPIYVVQFMSGPVVPFVHQATLNGF